MRRPSGAKALPTREPFHFEATVRAPQRRPVNPVEVWEGDRYLRVLATGDELTAGRGGEPRGDRRPDLGPGAALGRIIERFGDHRGYLYFCALGGGLLAKGLIRAAPPWS